MVIPEVEEGARVTLPLKFSLPVSVTFNRAPVWPRFRSCPVTDIEKSPTLTVIVKERLREVAESEPFIVTAYVPGVDDWKAQTEGAEVTVEFRVTGLGEQPVTLKPDGETDGNRVMEPVRWLIALIVTIVCGLEAPELKLTELAADTVKSETTMVTITE